MLASDVYERLLNTAATISEPLRETIDRIGPIEIALPKHASVAECLFIEIIN